MTNRAYRIVRNDCDVETHEELLFAMRRARALAEKFSSAYEIRDEEDFVLVVVLSSKREDRGVSMPRAIRHNAKLTAKKFESAPEATQCPGTGKLHAWRVEPPQHRLLFRCTACNALGYQVGGVKTVAHKCST